MLAEELQMLLVVCAGDAVGPHQRFAIDLDADHHEPAIDETQTLVARGTEGEKRVVPVMDGGYRFGDEGAHSTIVLK